MALQQDTVSIDLAKGVNQKVDDKVAGADQSSVLQDARFDKDGRLTKRNGLTAQDTSFLGDPGFINSVVLNSISCRSSIFAHGNQLCMESNGNLFAQYTANDDWVFKGTYVPLSMDVSSLDANIRFTDTVTVQGVTVSGGDKYIYVSEENTGTLIARNILNGGEKVQRLIGFNSLVYAVTGSSGFLYARPVSILNGSVGSAILLASNTSYPSSIRVPNVSVTSSASAIGEAAFIAYSDNTVLGAKILPFLSTGSISGLGILSGSVSYQSILIEPTVSPNVIYNSSGQNAASFSFGSTTYLTIYYRTFNPSVGTSFISSTSYDIRSTTIALSPINNIDLFIYSDFYPRTAPAYSTPEANLLYSDFDVISMARVNSVGSVTLSGMYARGLDIAGNAFRDIVRKTIYLPSLYRSPLQSTVFITDTLEGRNLYSYVMGKTLFGRASTAFQSSAGFSSSISQCLPTELGGDVFRFTNNGYFIDTDLTPDNPPQTQFLSQVTHATGGMLWAYDGRTMAEHNFLISPELNRVTTGSLSMTLTGTGSQGGRSTFTLNFKPGINYVVGSGTTNWFGFSNTSDNYYLWYKVDGVGVDPAPVTAPTRFGIELDLLSSDTAQDVANKHLQPLAAVDYGVPVLPSDPYTSIDFRCGTIGSTTAPLIDGLSRRGPLFNGGSYQYCSLLSWVDKNGNNYRSAPTVPTTVSALGSGSGLYEVWTSPITNKTISEVSVEYYRTQSNGTTFYFLGSSAWNQSTSYYPLVDTVSDSSISSRRILYTDGGILENTNIGACKSVASFKKRLQVTGIADGPYAIYYSKAALNGEPVNFSEELFYNVDSDLDKVNAVAQMDDKSIVFKSNLIYAISGDGANDLGAGSTFSEPLLVAADVGTDQPNSIVLYTNGLIFKSQKGIFNLTRSLSAEYVGAPVEDYNSFLISGSALMPNQTEIRFTHTDTSTALIYNYYFNRWDFFTNHTADACSTWNNKLALARSNGVAFVENNKFYDIQNGSQSYSVHLETTWLKLKGLQDFQRIYQLDFLGEYKSPHVVTVNVSYDYDLDPSNSDDYFFDATQIIGNPSTNYPGGSVYQFQVGIVRQKCESIKVKFTEVAGQGTQESLYLNNLSANVGLKKGLNKLPAEKST